MGRKTTGSRDPSAHCQGSVEPGRCIAPFPLHPLTSVPSPREVPGLLKSELGETLTSKAPREQVNPFPLLIPAKKLT